MKLRSCVGDLSACRMDGMLEEKRSCDKVIDKKENELDKKYNLRAQNRSDYQKRSSNQNLKKLSERNNKTENRVANCAVDLGSQGKENKIKKRPKRAVSHNCSLSSASSITGAFEDRKQVTGIMNITKNPGGKKCITRRKIVKCEKINDKVPLYEISNDCPIIGSDLQNGLINDKDVRSQYTSKYAAKLPFWRKKQNKNVTEFGPKRKSFVDVYDISQDEDISCETKHKKRKINSRKNLKRHVIKKKPISSKNANFNHKYSILKPVHNRRNILTANFQSNDISSNPPTLKVNTTALSPDKKTEIIFTEDIIEENGKNCIVNTTAVSSDKKSEIIFAANIVEENSMNCFMNADDLNITSAHVEIDNTPTDTKSQEDEKTFLLNLADELEKSFLIPRMTSTPDSTMLNNPVTNHPLSSKLIVNISSIIPRSKKGFKIPVTICKSLSDKETDITLFESPVKKSQKKNPVKLKSPRKNIQIDLFKNFIEQPKVDNLENSVLEPKKAYHSPDNFKTHLARTKRISEVTKKDTKKSKDEILIEKMAQHFEDISSTELCIA